jgi:hypothetical protein
MLGSRRSDFKSAAGSEFSWQHDARFLGNEPISLFDNNCRASITPPPGTLPSHGLMLELNLTSMTVKAAAHAPLNYMSVWHPLAASGEFLLHLH